MNITRRDALPGAGGALGGAAVLLAEKTPPPIPYKMLRTLRGLARRSLHGPSPGLKPQHRIMFKKGSQLAIDRQSDAGGCPTGR